MASAGNVALITGANQGIGLGATRLLAAEHPEYHIIIGARDPSRGAEAVKTLSSQGLSNVSTIQLDVASESSITAARETISSTHGRLDILINNAGVCLDWNPEATEWSIRELLQRTFDVNTFGAAAVTEAFLPLLEKSNSPRIVFVSSYAGSLSATSEFKEEMSNFPLPAYRASKAALNMLMLCYAGMLKEKGFKVNALCPGYVATNINGFSGSRTAADAARDVVRLATLGEDGETGTFSNSEGAIPW